MRMSYFGDSYDFVKQGLLRCLTYLGPWSVHPMFTESVTGAESSALQSFLGARIISTAVLEPGIDRSLYFEDTSLCDHLFLDPNTGVSMKEVRGKKAPHYLFISDLLRLAKQRSDHLTMVFDQSLGHGAARNALGEKLNCLRNEGISGFAYVSHACFMIVSPNESLVDEARSAMLNNCRLPETRFVSPTTA